MFIRRALLGKWRVSLLGVMIVMFLGLKVMEHNLVLSQDMGGKPITLINKIGRNDVSTSKRLHNLWTALNENITRKHLHSGKPQAALSALATARIVYVDVTPFEESERGSSEKWVVTLDGGQKAMMKLDWSPEDFGNMKPRGHCNDHFELPSSEIAAYHLLKVLGFHNNVFVTGRWIDLATDLIPVASQEVMKQIRQDPNGTVCITGKFYLPIISTREICPPGGLIRASLAYWVPRKLKQYTFPPNFMPFSTPNMKRWGGLNNKTFCYQLREEFYPYKYDWYYDDLFDFAVVDALSHHYDTKHYAVYDDSPAAGLTVRLDLGRTFCNHQHDFEDVMLAPIRQCCRLRRKTYEKLRGFQEGELSAEWKASMASDPLAPVMAEVWLEVLERRRTKILNLVDECARLNNGLENVLV